MPAGLRPARFAGSWYPGEPDALRDAIQAATPEVAPGPAVAVVAPHAGYRYSLAIAAAAYARAEVPPVAVVLCPNHTVPPPIVSVWSRGAWETPLGRVEVDEALAARIVAECPGVVEETGAHLREHAIELQLPLLQVRRAGLRIVPIVVAAPAPAALEALGLGIARAVGSPREALLVASTDMTHQEPAAAAAAKDRRALARVLELDPRGLLETCRRNAISMCGVRPTAAVLWAARALGARTAELVRYGHSGEVSGDDRSVVGYAGVVIR
jgi:hypothetical protein